MSIALTALCTRFAAAQANLPDPMSAPPSNSNFYYKNHGQIVDENGNLHPEIRYYTEHTYPEMYLADDKISFVATRNADTSIPGDVDSIGRIDLQFICNKQAKNQSAEKPTAFVPCGVMQVFEPSTDHLNYYLPQCPNGITDVPGYARVVYENAFPNIDVHFYSNAVAVKVFFVVKPGGNPSDIDLLFTGQDSIGSIGSSLAMYFGPWELQLPQALAYQITPSNNTTVLGWLPSWVHNGSGEVTLGSIGSYNPSEDLVISIGGPVQQPTSGDNLEWSTYYGDNGQQVCARIHSSGKNYLFHSLAEGANSFASQDGITGLPSSSNQGGFDWYVSMFDPIGKRLWATYYGGSGYEFPTAIDDINEEVWVAGYTRSINVPLGSEGGVFKQTANAGLASQNTCLDGLLACFEKKSGHLKYGTYFGGGGQSEDMINTMTIDQDQGHLYIAGTNEGITTFNNGCGTQTTGSFPLCSGTGNRFFQGMKDLNTDRDGFIAEFNLKDRSLVWSTLFGGYGADDIHTIVRHNNELYIGGLTYSGNIGYGREYPSPITSHNIADFPLANPGGGAFFQTSILNINYPSNQFIEKFNSDYQLEWGTLFGASINGTRKIAFAPDGSMYAYFLGVRYQESATISSSPNTQGKVPIFSSGTAYFEQPSYPQQQALISEFDKNLRLKWSTYLHSWAGGYSPTPQTMTSGMAVDDVGRLFVATYMNNTTAPVFYLSSAYWQNQNASTGLNDAQPYDNYLLAFNTGNEVTWGTFFGDAHLMPQGEINSRDAIFDITTSNGHYLYLTGYTECPESPYTECPSGAYCDQTYNPGMDCFISRFNISQFPIDPDGTGIKNNNVESSLLTVFPNPAGNVVNVSFINRHPDWKNAYLGVYDQSGKLIKRTNIVLKQGVNQFKINMNGYASGVYTLKLSGEDKAAYVKFIRK